VSHRLGEELGQLARSPTVDEICGGGPVAHEHDPSIREACAVHGRGAADAGEALPILGNDPSRRPPRSSGPPAAIPYSLIQNDHFGPAVCEKKD
jgi:hypothetical protein